MSSSGPESSPYQGHNDDVDHGRDEVERVEVEGEGDQAQRRQAASGRATHRGVESDDATPPKAGGPIDAATGPDMSPG